jgi:flagellar hook protein FlgE
MMTQAFYTGISGIQNNSTAIDAVSNNLANIDTIGYRGYDVEFASLFEKSLNRPKSASSIDSTIGVGARVQATSMKQTSGSLILSDRSTDLAIDGDGWFGVQADGDPIFTRDGAFTFDANDDLVTVDGYHVLGTMGKNIEGEILTKKIDDIPLGDIQQQEKLNFPKYLIYPPEPTKNATFLGNIGTEDATRTMSATVVDPNNNKNALKLTYTKSATQNSTGILWDVVATVESIDGNTIYDTKTGQVAFDDRGALLSSTLTTIDNNGATVNINLGSEFNGVVSISNLDITSSSSADGTIGGELMGYDINKNAEVIATFTNGMQSSVGKIAVYHFQNDQGLQRLSGSRFRETPNSGQALFFKDENGQNILGANFQNFKLENSNISMQYGLTELIILQRAYDASSKLISTADQMMQKALQMDA